MGYCKVWPSSFSFVPFGIYIYTLIHGCLVYRCCMVLYDFACIVQQKTLRIFRIAMYACDWLSLYDVCIFNDTPDLSLKNRGHVMAFPGFVFHRGVSWWLIQMGWWFDPTRPYLQYFVDITSIFSICKRNRKQINNTPSWLSANPRINVNLSTRP